MVATEQDLRGVVVDGEVALNRHADSWKCVSASIDVLVGSGAAIRVVYNGRDLGLMGTFGQVVSNIYTASEVITPTALPSPTGAVTMCANRYNPADCHTKLNEHTGSIKYSFA